jgi:hypothetical protein
MAAADPGRAARKAGWIAEQLRLGRVRCPSPAGLDGRLGETVWTERLEWRIVAGDRVCQGTAWLSAMRPAPPGSPCARRAATTSAAGTSATA